MILSKIKIHISTLELKYTKLKLELGIELGIAGYSGKWPSFIEKAEQRTWIFSCYYFSIDIDCIYNHIIF